MNRWYAPLGLTLGVLLIGTLWLHGQNAVPEARKEKDKEKEPSTVTTTGTAKLRVKCDAARVVGSVETVAATVKQAREESNGIVSKITGALKALKLDNVKMKTANLSIEPRLEKPKDDAPPKIVGYRVSYDFTVLIENNDVEKLNAQAGKVLDTVLENGANKVDRITFFKKDESALQREVRTNAVRDALANARALLAGAAIAKYEVTQIYDAPSYAPAGAVFQGAFGAGQPAPAANNETQIMAGELELSCTVTVTCSY
jgi:uncharacterized protein YggE